MRRLALLTSRWLFGLVVLYALAVFGMALYLQYGLKQEPCNLCILQRFALTACLLVALTAVIHNPGRRGTCGYALLLAAGAVTGLVIAIKHIWIQAHPPLFPDCGAGGSYILDTLPLAEALSLLFQGTGDCSKVDWTFLGLSIPQLSLLTFTLVLAAAVLACLAERSRP